MLLREGNGSLNLQSGRRDFAGADASFFCRKGSKLLLEHGAASFHFLGETTFSYGETGIVLRNGALLVDWRTRGTLGLESFDATLQVSGKCVLFVQATTNGGLKLIDLAGRGTVEDTRHKMAVVNLSPGELVFAKPQGKGFSDKLNVNLKTLVATSALIHEFPDSGGLRRDLARAILEQETLIRKRYRAVVGDARTPDTFDIRELPLREDVNETNSTD